MFLTFVFISMGLLSSTKNFDSLLDFVEGALSSQSAVPSLLCAPGVLACDTDPAVNYFVKHALSEGSQFVAKVSVYLEKKGFSGAVEDLGNIDSSIRPLRDFQHLLMSSRVYDLSCNVLKTRAVSLSEEIRLDVYVVFHEALLYAAGGRESFQSLCDAVARWGLSDSPSPQEVIGFALKDVMKANMALLPYLVEVKSNGSINSPEDFFDIHILSEKNNFDSVIASLSVYLGDIIYCDEYKVNDIVFAQDLLACRTYVDDPLQYCFRLPMTWMSWLGELLFPSSSTKLCAQFRKNYEQEINPVRELILSMRKFLGEEQALFYEYRVLTRGDEMMRAADQLLKAEDSLQRLVCLAKYLKSVPVFRKSIDVLGKWKFSKQSLTPREDEGLQIADFSVMLMSKTHEERVQLAEGLTKFLPEKKLSKQDAECCKELLFFSHLFFSTNLYDVCKEIWGKCGVQIGNYSAAVNKLLDTLKAKELNEISLKNSLFEVVSCGLDVLPYVKEKDRLIYVFNQRRERVATLKEADWRFGSCKGRRVS